MAPHSRLGARTAAMALLSLFLLGCAVTHPDSGGTRADFEELRLQVSGGLTGLVRVLRVRGDGVVWVADRRRGRCARGAATRQELDALAAMAARVEFDRKTAPSAALSTACRDCLDYDLTLIDARGVHRTAWVGPLPESDPRQALIRKLAGYFALLESAGSRKDCLGQVPEE